MQNVQKQLEHKFLGKYLNIFNVNITKLQYLYRAIKLFLKTKWKSKKCTTKLFFHIIFRIIFVSTNAQYIVLYKTFYKM